MKITVFGDIMCEPPVLKASKDKNGEYNFDGVFEKVRPLFSESDYVISNMEFPLAGEDAKYTDNFFVFNAPDEFAKSIKNAGVDLVSTVNNHTLDRGVEGMFRTNRVLAEIGLDYTGTYLPEKGREEAYYFEVDGVKFAVVAYTYTTNFGLSGEDEKYLPFINYLRPYNHGTYLPEVLEKMYTWVDRRFGKMKEEHRAVIKMCVGQPNTIERADDKIVYELAKPYMDKFVSDIKTAKEKADFVICFPHVGGQFNKEPGEFSKYVVNEAVKAGADAVLASHSHMVQKIVFTEGVPCAYSLGNFSMSPNSTIIVKKNLPEYGLAVHLYIDDKKVTKVTFSILKAVERHGKQLVSWPVDELYKTLKRKKDKERLEKDVKQIYKWVAGEDILENIIQREYTLEMKSKDEK